MRPYLCGIRAGLSSITVHQGPLRGIRLSRSGEAAENYALADQGGDRCATSSYRPANAAPSGTFAAATASGASNSPRKPGIAQQLRQSGQRDCAADRGSHTAPAACNLRDRSRGLSRLPQPWPPRCHLDRQDFGQDRRPACRARFATLIWSNSPMSYSQELPQEPRTAT